MMSFHYGLLQALYWMLFAAINGFVAVFLLARGLDEAFIGLLVAISNTTAAILQPFTAGWIDRSKRWRIKDIGLMVVAATALGLGLGWLVPSLAVPVFFLAIILIWILQPIVNSIAIYYLNRGARLNFGITRAAGSLAFGVVSIVIGYLVKIHGADVLLIIGLWLALATAVCIHLFAMEQPAAETLDPYRHVHTGGGFWHSHRNFLIFLCGVVLLFTFHTFATTYLIRIAQRIGGDEATMGTGVAIAAIAEIPFFILSDQLIRRFGVEKILIFASLFWVIKAVGLLLAPSVPIFYLVLLTQALSYAPLIPASIFFTNASMPEHEKVFGQALLTASFTVGGVIGSLFGGLILSYLGVTNLLLAGVAITLAGGIIISLAVGRREVV